MESGKQCAAALKEAGFTSVDLLDVAEKDFVVTLAQGGYDVVYVAMHGRFGEGWLHPRSSRDSAHSLHVFWRPRVCYGN